MNIDFSKKENFYLKRFAALQFAGSRENYSTRDPIHLLQQRSSDRDWLLIQDAVENHDMTGAFYMYDEVEYDNIEDVVKAKLGICDFTEEQIEEYNTDMRNWARMPYYTYQEFLNLSDDEYEWGNYNELDYLDAYDIPDGDVIAAPRSGAFETMAMAFTHQELENQKELLHNHIFEDTRTYAICGSSYSRDNEEVSTIMHLMMSLGESLLLQDLHHLEFSNIILTDKEYAAEEFGKNPGKAFETASFTVKDNSAVKPDDVAEYHISVMSAGEIRYENHPVVTAHYVVVDRKKVDGSVSQDYYIYPFDVDWGNERLMDERSEKNALSGIERLFFYILYRTALPDEKAKKLRNLEKI